MIAVTRSSWLAARSTLKVLMSGMPPPTAASKYTSTSISPASSRSSGPCAAITTLLAVTTCLRARIARSIQDRAGSAPPATSTTMSMAGSSMTWWASVVSSSEGTRGRALPASRTATRRSASPAPARRLMVGAQFRRRSATSAPTVPAPISPTPSSAAAIRLFSRLGARWPPATVERLGLSLGEEAVPDRFQPQRQRVGGGHHQGDAEHRDHRDRDGGGEEEALHAHPRGPGHQFGPVRATPRLPGIHFHGQCARQLVARRPIVSELHLHPPNAPAPDSGRPVFGASWPRPWPTGRRPCPRGCRGRPRSRRGYSPGSS